MREYHTSGMQGICGLPGPCKPQVCRGGGGSSATADLWIPQELGATDLVAPGREDGTSVVVPRVAAAPPFSMLRPPSSIC